MSPRTMGLAEALARDVAEATRTKGNRYFLGGAVRAIEGSDTHVAATVRGSQWYRVSLRRDGEAFSASCQCPYFMDRHDFCKHIWSVVLAADAEGLLIGDAPLTEDAFLEPDLGAEVTPAGAGAREPEPLPREPWQRFLQSVDQRASGQDRAATRYAQGEILYVIDRQATAADSVPTVQVQWRTRKRNGEWGKAQPAALGVSDVSQLPEEDDREIVALLLGATDAQALGLNYVSVGTRASFRISGPLIERLLPLIART